MKKLLLPLLAVLTLAAAAPATPSSTATVTVKITRTAFSPSRVTIKTGDSVTWKNTDTQNHQVVANNGAFVSKILAPGQTYTFHFRASGTYRYHDGLHPAITGTVVVTGPPPAVSLNASLPIIVYGQSITLSGVVSNHKENQTVTIYQQPYPQASFAEVTQVRTTTGGAWDLVGVKPTIQTAYMVRWSGIASQPVQVGVRPQIGIGYKRGILYTKARAAVSFAGKAVFLQRLSRYGQWVSIKKIKLNRRSSAAVRVRLPRGLSRLRVSMSVNQAGAGYLAGFSPTLVVRRR